MRIDTRVPWTTGDAIFALLSELLLAALLIIITNNVLEVYWQLSFFDFVKGNPWAVFLVFLIQNIILFLSFWFFCLRPYRPSADLLGLRRVKPAIAAALIIAVFLINFVITALYNSFSAQYQVDLPGFGIQEPHLPVFGVNVTGMVLLAIVAIAIAPIIEEVFFRGFLQQAFTKRFGLNQGVLLTSLIFAIAHFEFQVIIPIFILSVLLGWMFIRAHSIWPAIIFHAINNSLALLIEFAVLNV